MNLDQVVWGNSVSTWLLAAAMTLGVGLGLVVLKRLLARKVGHFATRTQTAADDVVAELLAATRPSVLAVVAVVIGARSLTLSPAVMWMLRVVLTVALALQIALWGNRLLARWIAGRSGTASGAGATGYAAVHFIARLLLWSLVALLALDNLGIDITALVASLGVGGIAVALAVQNILGDIFCSLSIVFDRPFEVGDFIIVDDLMGTVEQIGIKTTRVRSLGGEQLVFSNSDLVGSRIRNYKRMWERRVVFSFGVTYQTPPEKLERVCGVVREIVEGIDDARLDRVHFARFGDSALIFEVVYYVRKPDYNIYMDVQQTINLALMRRCQEMGIEFAYPTQTIYLQRCDGAEASSSRDGAL